MEIYEYIHILLKLIPEEIVKQYSLLELVNNDGYIYMELGRGMYGLAQAEKLAYEQLSTHLTKNGYYPSKHTLELWLHRTRSISSCLVIDDFGVKYDNPEDAYHLINVLQQKYQISEDWAGTSFFGVTLEWDYVLQTVILSMPG